MHSVLVVFAVSISLAATTFADTVLLRNGLRVHGTTKSDGDDVLVQSGKRTYRFAMSKVKEIQKGESRPEEYARRSSELKATDGPGWFRLALWAKESRLSKSTEAYERVIGIDPNHRAARRELGFERIGEEWVRGADAKRRKGFVLCAGTWMLPEEADRLMRQGLMKQAKVTSAHHARAKELVRGLLDDDPQIRRVALSQIDELPDAALLRPLEKALVAPDVAVRVAAVKKLSRIGDRVALPWLIRSSMYDAKADVRNAAFRSIQTFKDADVFYPYARALFSKHPRSRIMAAKALAGLEDMRGMDLILRRVSIGIGESPRVNLMVGTQTSYIQDFDVEIAQAAAIGDPIVSTIRDGIVLDFKVMGGWGDRWIVEERRAYASALASLSGRDYGEDWKKYAAYAKEQGLPRVRLK
jgi:hypothetical protein